MADSASVLTSKISEKGKLTNSINRTTSETLRLNDSEKVVNSPNSLSSTAPRKKTSFQITSVIVGSRTSNDGGDDSADDLDESHAEDISEVLDNSRITDLENETPSYSEDTFSKDDVFFNASSSLVSAPVIPTSSQYGLAIVATPENSESALNPPDSSGNSDTVDTTGVDVTESVINLGVVSTKHDPEMRDMHPPAPRTERFKVVKIESTEPFKRGRWVCMDYLDHNIAQKEQSQVSSAKIESSECNIQVSLATDIPNSAPSDYTSSVNSVIEVSPLESQVPVPTELINNCAPLNMQPNDSQVNSQMPLSSVPSTVPASYPSVSPGQSLQNSMQMGHIINSSAPPPQVSQQSQSLSQVNMQQILGNTSQHQSLQSQQMQQILSGANVMPMQQQQAPIPQTMQQQQPVMQQPMQTMQQMHQTNQQYQPQQQAMPPQQNIQQQQTMPQQQAPMPQQQTIQPSIPQQQQTIPQQQSLPQQQTLPQQAAVSQPQPTLTQQPSLTQQQALQQQAMQQNLPQQQTMPQQQQAMSQQQPLPQQQSIPPQSQTMPQQQQPLPQQPQGIPQQQNIPQPQQQQTMPQQQQPLQQQQQQQTMPQQQQQTMPQQQQQQMPQQQSMPQQQQSLPQQQQSMPQQQQSMPQQQQTIPQQQTMPQQQQTMAQQQQPMTQQQQTMPQQQPIPQQQFQTLQQPQQPMMQQQMPQQTLQTQMPVQQVQMQPGVQQMPIQQTQNQQQQMMQQSLQQMQQQPSQMHQVPYSQAMQQTQQPVMTQAGQQQVPGMLPQMHPQMGYQTNQMMPGMQPQPIMNIQSQPHLQPQYYQTTQQMPTGIITSQPGMMTQGGMSQVSMQGSTPNLPPLQTYPSASVPQPMQVQGMPQTPPIPSSVQYTMPHLSQTNQPLSMPMSMQQPMSMPQPQPTPQQQPPLQQPPPQPAQSYAGVSSPAQSYTHGMSSSSVPSALMMEHPLLNGEHPENPTAALIESLNEVTAPGDEPGEDAESTSGANAVAIDNKIEQAMDLVKSHLMYAVREEVEVLKEKIAELMERIGQLEAENATLRAGATPETLAMLPPPSQTTTTNP